MGSTKNKFLSWEEVSEMVDNGEELNPIDQFINDWSPAGEEENDFRTKLFEAVNFEDEESKIELNMNLINAFMEHCKNESDFIIPDSFFESFFNA